MRSGSDFQWNNIDGRCFGIYFQNSIAWRNRFGLHSFLLYSVRVHPAFKNLGRDGKQCDDETDGTYSNGDPGYPPVIDLDIISVLYKNVDIIEVVNSTTSLLSKIEDAVLQKEGH